MKIECYSNSNISQRMSVNNIDKSDDINDLSDQISHRSYKN